MCIRDSLCWKHKPISEKRPALIPLTKLRFLLTLVGFFSLYCGLLYNEFFTIPLNIFGSCYRTESNRRMAIKECTYLFGLDPAWLKASNDLAFTNSLKMKTAVIIGVSQMLLGLGIKAANLIYFSNWLDFCCEFVPQVLFLLCTFFYMVVSIFIKWGTDWTRETDQAPSIISQFINMIFNNGDVDKPLFGNGQEQIELQQLFLALIFTCIFVMLIPKPLILYLRSRKRSSSRSNSHHEKNPLLRHPDEPEDKEVEMRPIQQLPSSSTISDNKAYEEHEIDMGEVLVHVLIETIEFVLGSISHTASYLRLWALSLAHSKLSSVFFKQTLGGAIESGNVFGVFVGFFVFANLTFFVLLCMDLLECFLHSLRLHWVEFQTKFYKGDGYKFEAYSFQQSIEDFMESRLSE
eukprot:TRINITY_DN12464_c0_g1_i1.p1 TRINITY_DN12464_c0_g1~~TRINITY_DN12464_c0_g1_i1.p1  ORF type:complete len:406 (+),score=45.61 TRINITY_DN12464_c0_g1_i1:64-1281(+)